MKTSERHLFILKYREKYTVKAMCKTLGVSESGYYRWLRNRNRPNSRQLLSVKIGEILAQHPDNANYGVDRIRLALLQRGITVSRRTVYRAMKEAGLLHKRRIPHGITKATTEIQQKENLIKRDFTAEAPLRKFLTDITEIQCADGKLYVSPIMDCFSGEIVALEMRDNMKKELCIDTVRQLKQQFPNLNGAILHSDRGSQYTSEAFRSELKRCGITQSLSGTGHCFDNARMESFFATLKKEKIYRIGAYKLPREEVKTIVFRYVFVYYNRIRIYTHNPMGLPPVPYREWSSKEKQLAA
ncbi:MAG TPA: IS3 family transposase [Methanocorpusculum sp.]|nr:IS3 family transposase [Methanocorpusculum sp.]